MNFQETINEIRDKIVKEYKPEKIILFGSYAAGNEKPESDIDIIIIKKTRESFLKRLKKVGLLCKNIDEAIDILVYTPEEFRLMNSRYNPFIANVKKQSKVLYEKELSAHLPNLA